MEKQKNGIGRRKAAVTRVFLSKGEGSITVNDKDYKVYFPLVYLQNQVECGSAVGGTTKWLSENFDKVVTIEINPEFRPALKAAGLLKRDPRSVERKKFGHKKARRSYQFSKR